MHAVNVDVCEAPTVGAAHGDCQNWSTLRSSWLLLVMYGLAALLGGSLAYAAMPYELSAMVEELGPTAAAGHAVRHAAARRQNAF